MRQAYSERGALCGLCVFCVDGRAYARERTRRSSAVSGPFFDEATGAASALPRRSPSATVGGT
jgi:hypothetical protein